MNAISVKQWKSLCKRDQDIIKQEMAKILEEQLQKEEVELQKIYMKLCCKNLHESFGFDKDRCYIFLGNWFRQYDWNSRFKTKAEQTAALDEEMAKIFGKDGYPQEFIEYLANL